MKCTAFETGDGAPNDGSTDEITLREQTTQDCIRNCIEEKKKDNAINGVTVENKDDNAMKHCYCERNMFRVMNGHIRYKTCFLVPN